MVWSAWITWVRFPRLVAWCLLVAAAWMAVRIPFAAVYFLPSVAEFSPGFVLAPLAGLYAGPAGVIGILAGTLAGDLLLGQWGRMTGFRMAAYGLSALYMMVLSPPGLLTSGHRGWLRIGLLLIPICLTAAAWIAVGGALQRLYPFAYLLGLNSAQFLVFSGLLAPALLRFLARRWAPRFGTWHDVVEVDEARCAVSDTAPMAWLMWGGALAACGLGGLLSGMIYGVWPIGVPWLGRHTGAWVTLPVLVSLAIQAAGMLWWLGHPQSKSTAPGGRFDRTYLPPIQKQ